MNWRSAAVLGTLRRWGGGGGGGPIRGVSLALLTHLLTSTHCSSSQGEDPGLFAFAKSNMEYAVLSVETLQNTIANSAKTLKRLKVLVGKRRRWESCRRDYYLNHSTAPANVVSLGVVCCSPDSALISSTSRTASPRHVCPNGLFHRRRRGR